MLTVEHAPLIRKYVDHYDHEVSLTLDQIVSDFVTYGDELMCAVVVYAQDIVRPKRVMHRKEK